MATSLDQFEIRPVLFVEQRAEYIKPIKGLVGTLNHVEMSVVPDALQALSTLKSSPDFYHLVMSGPLTSEMYGEEMARRIKEGDPKMPVIMLDEWDWVKSERWGIHANEVPRGIAAAIQAGYVDLFYGYPIGADHQQTIHGFVDDIRRLQQLKLEPPDTRSLLQKVAHRLGRRLIAA